MKKREVTQCVPEPPGAGGHSSGACGCRTPPCSPSGAAAGPESDPGPPSQRYTTALAPGVAPCPEDAETCLVSPQLTWRNVCAAAYPDTHINPHHTQCHMLERYLVDKKANKKSNSNLSLPHNSFGSNNSEQIVHLIITSSADKQQSSLPLRCPD